MKGKFFFVCCAAAVSSVLLAGITLGQDYPILPTNGATDKNVRVDDDDRPRPSVFKRILRRGRPGNNSQMERDDLPAEPQDLPSTPPPQSEAPYLKELAEWLAVPIPKDATPGDIAFAIRQTLSETTRYSGAVLSDEAFEECRAAIPTTKDTKTFEAYHAFIKKIAGKNILVFNQENGGDYR